MAERGVAVTGTVYQLRVVLAGISPMVWRRLLVPAETSVAGLHEILQAAFGWSDEHLHRFTIHAVEYGLWRPGSAGFSRDARQVLLAGFGLRPGGRFTYEYNFFAGWRHDIRVEEILPRSPRRRYPACTGGARQAPPEDCGSLEEFLALRQRWPPVLIAARMAEILAGLLDADGDAPAGEGLGDHRDELARLLDLARLNKLDRTALNSVLHALDITPESVSDGRQQMKITVQIVIDAQDGTPPATEQVAVVARDDLTMASAGLALAEAHEVLSGIQHHLAAAQAAAAAVAGRPCGSCGRVRARKDTRHIVLRTLFGTLRLDSPRYKACPCAAGGPATVSPVAAMLPERTTPELLLWEARYAALTSYGAAATLLSEAFPLGRTLHATAVRQRVERTATRLEDELGEERFSFIDT